jgi:dihydroneopterin aldolase
MKTITIRDIKVFAHHGVLPAEKEQGQEFLIDVEITLEEDAAREDDLETTVDYAEVAGAVAGIATSRRYDLLETLASELVDHLLVIQGVKAASVTVKKPRAPMPVEVGWVGVTISRERQPGRSHFDGQDVLK